MKTLLLVSLLLSGCVLAPDSLRVETEHESHIEQHLSNWSHNYLSAACTPHCGHYQIGGVAEWRRGGFYFSAGDYRSLEQVNGMREVFEARAGYEFKVKP